MYSRLSEAVRPHARNVANLSMPFTIARPLSTILKIALMHPIVHELLPIRLVHARFANWERAKHRADFFAKVGFPDSHPLRHAVDQISRDLEEHRCAADRTVAGIVR